MTSNQFPALTGQPVTEAHARICDERGHATHTVDGTDSGVCPRCGAVVPTEEFAQVLEMTDLDTTLTALAVYGSDFATRDRNAKHRATNRAALNVLMDTWSLATLRSFAAYRRTH